MSATDVQYALLFGKIGQDQLNDTSMMARCACVACDSCTCGCSCRISETHLNWNQL